MAKLTYTQQVAAFREELAGIEAKLDILLVRTAPEPSIPPVVEPPEEDPVEDPPEEPPVESEPKVWLIDGVAEIESGAKLHEPIVGGGDDKIEIKWGNDPTNWKGTRLPDGGVKIVESHGSGYTIPATGVTSFQVIPNGVIILVADLPAGTAPPAPDTPPVPIENAGGDPYPAPGTIINGVTYLQAYRRGRSGALPAIVRTADQLKATKLVLPYDGGLIRGNEGRLPTYSFTLGAYDKVGLMPYMGGTGDRQDIGLVTKAQGEWLCGLTSEHNMLVQAEAHGSVPVHGLMDGRIIDVFKYPLATYDYRAAREDRADQRPYFDIRIKDDISGPAVTPEGAHYPSLNYVAYLATEDQYYLEELQYEATFMICGGPPGYHQGKGIIWPHQQRQWAWGIRAVIQAYIATPDDDVPAPLLPKSYWRQIVLNNIEVAWNNRLGSYDGRTHVDPALSLITEMGFLGVNADLRLAPWQQDYIGSVLGWAVYTGRVPELRQLYDWHARQAVKRATGPLRSRATLYWTEGGLGKTWADTLSLNGFPEPTADGNFAPDASVNYSDLLRSNLAVAALNNVPGAVEAHQYVLEQCRRLNWIQDKWAV